MSNEKFPASPYKKYLMNELFKKSLKRSHGQYMLQAHIAHCIMLQEKKIITKDTAKKIRSSLRTIEKKLKTLSLEDFTGDEEDLYFIIEQSMIAEIGVENAGALHTGRSRNDLGHTIFRMAFRDSLIDILDELLKLAENLFNKGLETRDSIITAWTHCQPAQPSTYAHYVGAILEVMIRDIDRLLFNYKYVDCSPYGAAAITTTGFPIDRNRTSDLLGFIEPVLNSYGAIASTDYILNTLGTIKSLTTHLGKYTVDQLDWARMEIGQIDIPDSWVQRSSIMPQKRNAVVFEHLRARYSTISSLCDVPSNSMKNTPFGDIDDIETEFHEHIHNLFDLLKITVPMMSEVVKVISVNSEHSKKTIDRFCLLSTELADSLVRTEDISFRQAHEIAAAASKYCVEKQVPLSQIPDNFLPKVFTELIGRPMKNNSEQLKQFLTPEYFVGIRTVLGGTASSSLDSAYSSYKKELNRLKEQIETHKKRHILAEEKLNQLS